MVEETTTQQIPKIVIIIEGGNCTGVYSDGTPIEVTVHDLDNLAVDTGEKPSIDRNEFPLEVY